MKQQFVCDICGKVYDTEEEALACELQCEEKKQAEIKKEEEAKAKSEEKEARHKQINDLIKAYIEDYNEFPVFFTKTSTDKDNYLTHTALLKLKNPIDLFDSFFNPFL